MLCSRGEASLFAGGAAAAGTGAVGTVPYTFRKKKKGTVPYTDETLSGGSETGTQAGGPTVSGMRYAYSDYTF